MTRNFLFCTATLLGLAACQTATNFDESQGTDPTSAVRTFATNFDQRPRYFPPHGPDLARNAVQYEDGVAVWTIEPGFITGDYDVRNGTERAEMGQKVDETAYVRQSFSVRADASLRAPERLLIAQVKPDGPTNHSPGIAAYMTRGGNAKCIDYSNGQQDQRIIETRPRGIDMLDGQWHRVVMEYHMSDTDGFCRVTIDGLVIVERTGHDSNPNDGFDLVMRIGPYRDAVPYSQTLYYDNWSVEQFRANPF
jgi:hypothetical protein